MRRKLISILEWLLVKLQYKFKPYIESSLEYSNGAIDSLVANGKVSRVEYQMYMLFHMNQNGKQYYKYKIDELFMTNVAPDYLSEGLIFREGQLSVFKEIKGAIDHINDQLLTTQERVYNDRNSN